MNKGSKVVCIDDVFPTWATALYSELPVKDKIYTIRQIDSGLLVQNINSDASVKHTFEGVRSFHVLLEEIKNPIHTDSKKEMGFLITRFREIEPPKAESVSHQVNLTHIKPIKVSPVKPQTRELTPAA